MQLFTILILVTLPIVFVQFYSANSYALIDEDKKVEALFEQIASPESSVSASETSDAKSSETGVTDEKEVALLQDESFLNGSDQVIEDMGNTVVVSPDVPAREHKKVRLIQGKKHVQGMDLLSILLMLKEKQK